MKRHVNIQTNEIVSCGASLDPAKLTGFAEDGKQSNAMNDETEGR